MHVLLARGQAGMHAHAYACMRRKHTHVATVPARKHPGLRLHVHACRGAHTCVHACACVLPSTLCVSCRAPLPAWRQRVCCTHAAASSSAVVTDRGAAVKYLSPSRPLSRCDEHVSASDAHHKLQAGPMSGPFLASNLPKSKLPRWHAGPAVQAVHRQVHPRVYCTVGDCNALAPPLAQACPSS